MWWHYLLPRFRKNRGQQRDLSQSRNLQQLIEQDQYEYYLIDVRSEGEFKKGHIPTAINVPFGRLSSFLPTDILFTSMIVYGRSPGQSARAAEILSDAGYFNVTSFGPFFKWRGPLSQGMENQDKKSKKTNSTQLFSCLALSLLSLLSNMGISI